MKFKNVKVGDRVKVKVDQQAGCNFEQCHKGAIGTVETIDPVDKNNYSVRVKFSDGLGDWGSHKGLKLVKENNS